MNRGARLILVRHGETEGESSIRYHGRTDVALSELGRAQMRLTGRAIETRHGAKHFARVFSSPLVRASEGARIVAGDSAPHVTIDEFAEVHFGLFEGLTADEIRARYRRIRRPGVPPAWVNRIYVLSRVTLGADVAVTSVILDAVKRAYPSAEILFVGPRKNYELFEADERIRHFPASYARAGTLVERLRASVGLREKLTNGIVVDPDSRLSQLGLIPVCDDPNYFFFESRSFGGNGAAMKNFSKGLGVATFNLGWSH